MEVFVGVSITVVVGVVADLILWGTGRCITRGVGTVWVAADGSVAYAGTNTDLACVSNTKSLVGIAVAVFVSPGASLCARLTRLSRTLSAITGTVTLGDPTAFAKTLAGLTGDPYGESFIDTAVAIVVVSIALLVTVGDASVAAFIDETVAVVVTLITAGLVAFVEALTEVGVEPLICASVAVIVSAIAELEGVIGTLTTRIGCTRFLIGLTVAVVILVVTDFYAPYFVEAIDPQRELVQLKGIERFTHQWHLLADDEATFHLLPQITLGAITRIDQELAGSILRTNTDGTDLKLGHEVRVVVGVHIVSTRRAARTVALATELLEDVFDLTVIKCIGVATRFSGIEGLATVDQLTVDAGEFTIGDTHAYAALAGDRFDLFIDDVVAVVV